MVATRRPWRRRSESNALGGLSDGLCLGEPLCADEDLPRFDACGAELFCGYPGIVGEAAMDVGFAVCVHDQQHTDAAVFGSGEWSAFMKAACSVTDGCWKIPPASHAGPASRMTAK